MSPGQGVVLTTAILAIPQSTSYTPIRRKPSHPTLLIILHLQKYGNAGMPEYRNPVKMKSLCPRDRGRVTIDQMLDHLISLSYSRLHTLDRREESKK